MYINVEIFFSMAYNYTFNLWKMTYIKLCFRYLGIPFQSVGLQILYLTWLNRWNETLV